MSYLPQLQTHSPKEEIRTLMASQSEKSLAGIKKARKQIESDAQLLANRIALLKQEELKAWKKMEETKKKAQEIYNMKKMNEEKQTMKQNEVNSNENKLKDSQIASAELRKKKKLERENMLEAIYQQKHQEMLEIRKQRQINDRQKAEFKSQVIQKNSLKSHAIRQQEADRAAKLQELKDAKQKMFQEEKTKYLEEEETRKKRKELEVKNLERVEMELIQKLQQTQKLQKSAYDDLETVLVKPASGFSSQVMQKSSSKLGLTEGVRSPKSISETPRVKTSRSINDY